MRFPLILLLIVCTLVSTASIAAAQCQLATDDPPAPQAEPFDQLDLSILDGIDPYLAELPQVPPAYSPLMFNKALAAARDGDLELAARIYQFMLKVDPKPVEIYNLACIYSLMNRPELATAYLEHAVQYGWTDLAVVDTDVDFDNVRDDPAFAAGLAELRQGQATAGQDRGTLGFAAAPVLVPYRIKLPEGYDPQQSYDVVLALHGAGDSADNFARLWGYFEQPGFILAVPQAPYKVAGQWGGGGNVWFGGLADQGPDAMRQQTQANERYLLDLLHEIKAQYKVRNVYLLGFSQGAVLSYATALQHPGEIAGIIVFGGRLSEDLITPEEIANGKPVRVFIAHGREDNFEAAQAAYEQLNAAGYAVQLFPYDGGHYINLTALKTAQAWMTKPS
jgi:phospholipase/carboxylesterase